jgi:hypothetical protein
MELWNYEIDHALFARVGVRAFRQCEAIDVTPLRGPVLGVRQERCGGDAMRGITWQGREGRHSLLVCDHHTIAYLGPMIGESK